MTTPRSNFVFLLAVLGAMALPPACGSRPDQDTSATSSTASKAAGSKEHPVTPPPSHVPGFSPDTTTLLAMIEKPAVAVVECESVSILREGTRSREAVMKARIVAAGYGAPAESAWNLTWYTQGEPSVKPGVRYLVAAESQGTAWTLIEAVETTTGHEAAAASAASEHLESIRRRPR